MRHKNSYSYLCLVTQGGRVVVKLDFYDAATEKIIFAEEKMFYKLIRPLYKKNI